MEPKHTPGPWKIETLNGDSFIWGNGVTALARVYGTEYDTENGVDESAANARLIKSAPLLFGMLEKTIAWIDLQGTYPGCRAAADSILALIYKAIHEATCQETKP